MRRSSRGQALRTIAEAIFYRGTPLPVERLDFIESEMLATLQAAGPRARTLFLLCLFGLVVLAPLWVGRLPTLMRLPLPLRIRALSRMENSPVAAGLVLAVKAALCVLYYEQPAVAAELRAAPGCLHVLADTAPSIAASEVAP